VAAVDGELQIGMGGRHVGIDPKGFYGRSKQIASIYHEKHVNVRRWVTEAGQLWEWR
jgi:hypothetical protein